MPNLQNLTNSEIKLLKSFAKTSGMQLRLPILKLILQHEELHNTAVALQPFIESIVPIIEEPVLKLKWSQINQGLVKIIEVTKIK